MKKGLVIQGPLFSPGFGPYEFKITGKFEKSWIEFDCRENILLTINKAVEFFDCIVLSTWDNQNFEEFLESLNQYDTVKIVVNREGEKLSGLREKGVHKYHQIQTFKAGLEELLKMGCEYAAKVRTDHRVDTEKLSIAIGNHQYRNPYSLGVPNINLYELDRLTDFYFVGKTQVMRDMCSNYLIQKEFCLDTHRDYFLGFLKFLAKRDNFINRIYQSESLLKSDLLSIFAWTHYFYPLKSNLFKDFHVRGIKVQHRLNGWIRWYFVFHSRSTRPYELKFITNIFVIFSIRILKKPTIRLKSFLVYRYYRLINKARAH